MSIRNMLIVLWIWSSAIWWEWLGLLGSLVWLLVTDLLVNKIDWLSFIHLESWWDRSLWLALVIGSLSFFSFIVHSWRLLESSRWWILLIIWMHAKIRRGYFLWRLSSRIWTGTFWFMHASWILRWFGCVYHFDTRTLGAHLIGLTCWF